MVLQPLDTPMNIKLFFLPLLLLFGSCAKHVAVTSNAFADNQLLPYGLPIGSSFFIAKTEGDNSLLAKEVSYKIGRILEDKGYLVTDSASADYYVRFKASMASSTALVSVPKYIPGPIKTTKGISYKDGKRTEYEERTQSFGSTVYVPEEQTFFHKTLTIYVHNAQHGRIHRHIINTGSYDKTPVWQCSSSSSDRSSDLREALDYLLVAAFKHFGKNTQRDVHTSVRSDDQEVKNLQSALF